MNEEATGAEEEEEAKRCCKSPLKMREKNIFIYIYIYIYINIDMSSWAILRREPHRFLLMAQSE